MYHRYSEKNKEVKKIKPRAGWDEEESGSRINQKDFKFGKSNFNPSNPASSFKNEISSVSSTAYSNYRPPDNNEVVQKTTISVEQKLIEDLIQPTGISMRPNETQIKEFSRRAKNLDRDTITRILLDKLSAFESMEDPTNQKVLVKILYIVELLLNSGLTDIFQEFSIRQEILESIRNYYSANKKLVEIVNQILHILNPTTSATSSGTVKNNGGSNFNILEESVGTSQTNNNLLGDLSQNENTANKSINIFNIFTNSNTNPNTISKVSANKIDEGLFKVNTISPYDSNSNIKASNDIRTQTKSFSFIKKANVATTETQGVHNKLQLNDMFKDLSLNNNNQNIATQSGNNNSSNKKSFSFIKSKEIPNPAHTSQSSNFESIFNSSMKTSPNTNSFTNILPTVDFTAASSTDIDEVFSKRGNVDIKQITETYSQKFENNIYNNKPYQSPDIDLIMSTNFDYNMVNTHIDNSKGNKPKDHFSFVSDLMKSKK